MLGKLLRLPLTGPLEGVVWVAAQLAKEAEREAFGQEAVMAELAELHRRLDRGELDEETFTELEDVLLDRLQAAQGRETLIIDQPETNP